jgi:hypothetical protein
MLIRHGSFPGFDAFCPFRSIDLFKIVGPKFSLTTDGEHRPVSVKTLAHELPPEA